MFNNNLTDGYYHQLIHSDFCDFLGYKLTGLNGKVTWCRFVSGFLGLADLPGIFTKIYPPLVAHWGMAGIQGFNFLDNGGFFNDVQQTAVINSLHIMKDPIRSGSVFSSWKNVWELNQKWFCWVLSGTWQMAPEPLLLIGLKRYWLLIKVFCQKTHVPSAI